MLFLLFLLPLISYGAYMALGMWAIWIASALFWPIAYVLSR